MHITKLHAIDHKQNGSTWMNSFKLRRLYKPGVSFCATKLFMSRDMPAASPEIVSTVLILFYDVFLL